MSERLWTNLAIWVPSHSWDFKHWRILEDDFGELVWRSLPSDEDDSKGGCCFEEQRA
ncbi:hypothetical protein CCACVL1_31018, partial [Corchorus capsularis]